MAIQPMLATAKRALPEGPGWSFEIKWDGYRILAEKVGDRVVLRTRNQNDVTAQYPSIVTAIRALPPKSVTLDGELVALDDHGNPSFQALQHRLTIRLVVAYYVFDLLELNGESLLRCPLDKRRLLFAAKVRAGFTPAVRRPLLERLRPLEVDRCPFADLPVTKHGRWGEGVTAEDMAEMQWVKPSMVVEVSFVEWTQAGLLRHPAFVALRDDKAAKDVRRI